MDEITQSQQALATQLGIKLVPFTLVEQEVRKVIEISNSHSEGC
jgi:hypothetical protein